MVTVMIDGRAVALVDNTSLELKEGYATTIYLDPITRKESEGVAVVRAVDSRRERDGFMEARVEFVDEPGKFYSRRIYRHTD